MCRIFGSVSRMPISQDAMRKASQSMFAGGPDQQWVASDKNWCAGTNRLAIQGVSGGQQPFRSGNLVCVFNGEIYNHDALRDQLELKGHRFSDSCDGNVLLPLFQEYGSDMLALLEGMYAFAIFTLGDDGRCVSVFLASDHAAMKTLFYHINNEGIYFASSLKSLSALVGRDFELRDEFVYEYLTRKSIWGPNTVYKGVHVLGAGEFLTYVSPEGTCHFGDYESSLDNPDVRSFEDAVEGCDGILTQEIERMANMDVPFCSILSGGLDSSYVTAILRRMTGRLDAFHVGYDKRWPGSESDFAQRVADENEVNLHQISVDTDTLPDLIKRYVKHLDQPNYAPHCLSTYILFKEIHDRGYKVAFSGEGADELFCGYGRFIAASEDKSERWFENFCSAYGVAAFRERTFLRHDCLQNLKEAFPRPGFDVRAQVCRTQSILDYDTKKRFPYYILRRVDSLSMANSVEVRMPFLQPRLIHFARSLPSSFLHAGGVGKRCVLKAGSKCLPQEIIERKKQPFTFPVGDMISQQKHIRDYVLDTVFNQNSVLWQYFDRALMKPLETKKIDQRAAEILWALLVLDEWHEANVSETKGMQNDGTKEYNLP